jgi:hypothetical protein
MEKINSNTNNLNGLSLSQKEMKNEKKELIDANQSLKSQTNEENSEEENNKINLPMPYIERNSSNSAQTPKQNKNLNLSNTLTEKKLTLSSNLNSKEDIKKQKRKTSNETLENGLNLDEQNLKEYYDKIEKELNKLKNEKKR